MKSMDYAQIKYGKVPAPDLLYADPVVLTDETMNNRLLSVKKAMEDEQLDTLCIYADREHGGNFGYITGFEPRFEEAMVVVHRNGENFLLLGNESLKMGQFCRINKVKVIHVPFFSLPNQPMGQSSGLKALFQKAHLCEGIHVGIVGWKLFTSEREDNNQIYEVPHFIVQTISNIVGNTGSCINASALFINPGKGVRVKNNANEIAHFEYGATLASNCVRQVMDAIESGKTERELAHYLSAEGQPMTVQPICASGVRFTNGEVAPRNKALIIGEPFSLTMGLRGGLTSRAGYIVENSDQLPEQASDYMEALVKPYYATVVNWYENMRIGITGGEIYCNVKKMLPPDVYGWTLNPGHLTATEEWLSSPIYYGSHIPIQSGMIIQMDIIPKLNGYGGINAEDGIAVADEKLRKDLSCSYPETWERIVYRRRYMHDILGIKIREEILPLSNTEGYLRPYLLNRQKAMYVDR